MIVAQDNVRNVTGYRSLAKNRDFTILWVGETINELGTSMSMFAFPLLTYALTGSAVATAAVEALFLGGLVAMLLPAGVIADRVDRRAIMVSASATGLIGYASLAIAGVLGHLTLPHVAVVALLSGVASGAFQPAQRSAIRTVVATEDLPTALSQDQARQHVASLLGGPIGGALYAVARWVPFAADAATYAVSCLTLSRLRTDLSAPPRTTERHPLADLREGFTFLWRWRFTRVLTAWATLANLLGNALFFAVMLMMVKAGYPPAMIGLTSTAAGLGGILGAVVAPWIIDRMPTGRLTVAIAWMTVLPVLPLLWSVHPYVVAACLFALLVMNPAGNAGISSYRLAKTPDALQGRVSSASQFCTMLLMPLSPVLGGALLEHVGATATVVSLVVASTLLALVPTMSRSIRSVPRPAVWAAEPVVEPEVRLAA